MPPVYQSYKPVLPTIAPFIEGYCQVTGHDDLPQKWILPWPGATLSFHFHSQNSLLSGIQDQPYHIVPRKGKPDLLRLRFQPAGLSRFTDIPQQEIANRRVTPEDLWGPAASTLYDRLQEIASHEQRIAILESFLAERYRPATTTEQLALYLAAWLRDEDEAAVFPRIRQLSTLSLRQVERRFKQLVGTDIQTYIRICRFDRARLLMVAHPSWRLTDVAYTANYYDQAHFSRDFKKLSGRTPRKFLPCGEGAM